MRGLNLLAAAAACLLVCVSSVSSAAQTRAETPAAAPSRTAQTTGPTAEEDFELDIALRRITEPDFHAETAVETSAAGGLQLKVGVALRASEIDVLLRNVRGRVRFRASLAPVQRLLDGRRAAPAAAPVSPP